MPIPKPISALWQTTDKKTVRLFQGDVLAVLKRLPAKSVQMVVTSPPYYGLRDYETAEWEGGEESCEHTSGRKNQEHKSQPVHKDGYKSPFQGTSSGGSSYLEQGKMSSMTCNKCGAKRIDQQIGSESSSQEFVAKMVEVFSAVHRVLRDDGTLWLNFGDCYGKNGNLMGMPWRVALALQADGWILRQDIIWAKPSPMPESVRNRCTKSHEYIFLFAKRSGYFYDAEPTREKISASNKGTISVAPHGEHVKDTGHRDQEIRQYDEIKGANKRSVWNVDDSNDLVRFLAENYPAALDQFVDNNKLSTWRISSEAYPGAHFATFPRKLIEPCILAGTSAKGACVECGAPWKRVIEKGEYTKLNTPVVNRKSGSPHEQGDTGINNQGGGHWPSKTVGWEPGCECNGKFVTRKAIADKRAEGVIPAGWDENLTSRESNTKDSKRTRKEKQEEIDGINNKPRTVTTVKYVSKLALENHPVRPCIVLDPFIGSGTTCVVALAHGLRSWGIDLSKDYLINNAIPRIEGVLLMTPALVHLMRIKPVKLTGGKPLVSKK